MKRYSSLVWALLALSVLAAPVLADVPYLINYQGVLTDAQGAGITGDHTLTFKIYRDSISTFPVIWSEAQSHVSVNNGLFNVILGKITPFSISDFSSNSRWMGISVDSNPEMTPRMRLTSVPWALRAAVADSALAAPGMSDSDWVITGINMSSGVAGNVGIGTTAPAKKLHIGDIGVPNAEGMIRLASRSGTQGSHRTWDIGVPETDGVSTGIGYSFVIDDIDLGTDPEFMVKWGSGRVGIGTIEPARKLHLDCGNVEDGIRIAWGSAYPTVYGDIKHGLSGGLVINSSAGGGTWADIQFQTNGTTRAYLTSDGKLGIGTSTPTALLDVAGTARVQVLQITGADVAERFPVRENAEPGMVVAIDPQRPGQLCLARGEYNYHVAGIISGAGDLPVGAVLGNLPGQEQGLPVALTGRVWVKCDASRAPIEPGDLLTTSAHPGLAMKVGDRARAQGAIIGKAMTALSRGQGLVLTLVSLQ